MSEANSFKRASALRMLFKVIPVYRLVGAVLDTEGCGEGCTMGLNEHRVPGKLLRLIVSTARV